MRIKLKSILILFLLLVFLMPISTLRASADMGPKPSIHITFENMSGELCYGTLLSKSRSTGPYSVWDGVEENALHSQNDKHYLDYEIWKTFVEYEDSDGYFFLQNGFEVSKNGALGWGYYPPSTFKILLYFPERNTFAISDVYKRYAFDSYYTVDLNSLDFTKTDMVGEKTVCAERLVAVQTYDYTKENVSFVARVTITIALELIVALLFGLREKKQFLCFALTNTFTQTLLNVLLNVIDYALGAFAFVFYYVILELVVLVIEAIFYAVFVNKISDQKRKKRRYVWYALVANLVSFISGLGIVYIIPSIF